MQNWSLISPKKPANLLPRDRMAYSVKREQNLQVRRRWLALQIGDKFKMPARDLKAEKVAGKRFHSSDLAI